MGLCCVHYSYWGIAEIYEIHLAITMLASKHFVKSIMARTPLEHWFALPITGQQRVDATQVSQPHICMGNTPNKSSTHSAGAPPRTLEVGVPVEGGKALAVVEVQAREVEG